MVQLEAAGPINTANATGGSLKLPAAPKDVGLGTPTSRLAKAESDIAAFSGSHEPVMKAPSQNESGIVKALEGLASKKVTAPATVSHHKSSAVSWIIDMMSRPEDAVTNEVSTMMNIAKGKAGGNAFQNIKAEAEAPLQGFFSSNPKYHETGSQLITQAADDFTKKGSTARKVMTNPWFKGIGGFAADVGLDPLTYIPGPDLLTVGKKAFTATRDVVRASKAGADLLPAIKAGAKDLGKTALEEAKKGPGAGGGKNPTEALANKSGKITADKAFGAALDKGSQDLNNEALFKLAKRPDDLGTASREALRTIGVPEEQIPISPLAPELADPAEAADRESAVDGAVQDVMKKAGASTKVDDILKNLSPDSQDRIRTLRDSMVPDALEHLRQTPQSAIDSLMGPRTDEEVAEDEAFKNGASPSAVVGDAPNEAQFKAILDGDYVAQHEGGTVRNLLGRGKPDDLDKFDSLKFSGDDEVDQSVKDYYEAKSTAQKVASNPKATPSVIQKSEANVAKAQSAAYEAYLGARTAGRKVDYYDIPGDETAAAAPGRMSAAEAVSASEEAQRHDANLASDAMNTYKEHATRAINNVGRMLGSPKLAANLLKGATMADGGAEAIDHMQQINNLLRGAWDAINPDSLFKTKAAQALVKEMGLSRNDVLDLISGTSAGMTDRAAEAEVAGAKGVALPAAAQESVVEDSAQKALDQALPADMNGRTPQAYVNDLLEDFNNRRESLYGEAKQSALDAMVSGAPQKVSRANSGIELLLRKMGQRDAAEGLSGDPIQNAVARAVSVVAKSKWGSDVEKLAMRDKFDGVKIVRDEATGEEHWVDKAGKKLADTSNSEFNGEDQARMLLEIHNQVGIANRAAEGGFELAGQAFDNARWHITMQSLRQAEDFLAQSGVPLYLGRAGDRISLKLSDALSALEKQNPSFFRRVFSNYSTAAPIMQLGRAISSALVGHEEMALDVLADRMATTRHVLSQTVSKHNPDFANGLVGKWHEAGNVDKLDTWHERFNAEFEANNTKYFDENKGIVAQALKKVPVPAGNGAREWLVRNMYEALPELRKSMDEAGAARGEKAAADYQSLISDTMSGLYHAASSSLPDLVDAVGNIPRDVANHPFVEKAAVDAATVSAQSQIPSIQRDFTQVWMNTVDKGNAFDRFHGEMGWLADAVVKAGEASFPRTDLASAAQFGGSELQAGAENLGEQAAERIEVGKFARFQGMFSTEVGTGPFHDAMRQSWDTTHQVRKVYLSDLDAVRRLVGRDPVANEESYARLASAWNHLVGGTIPENQMERTLAQRLSKTFTNFFGTSTGEHHVLGSLLNGMVLPDSEGQYASMDLFNGILKRYLNSKSLFQDDVIKRLGGFQYDMDQVIGKNPDGSDLLLRDVTDSATVHAHLVSQLANISGEDVINLMAAHVYAFSELASHASLASELETIARRFGSWSDTPKEGMRRIPKKYIRTKLNGKEEEAWKSPINHYFPRESYLSEAGHKWLARANELLHEASGAGEVGIEEYVTHFWQPVMSMYKAGLTMFRPAHHIDNAIGDTIMTYLAMGTRHALWSHGAALKVLKGRAYEGVDMVAAALDLKTNDFADDAKPLATLRLGGRKVPVTAPEIRQAVQQRALLPTHNSLTMVDELAGNQKSAVARFSHRLTNESLPGRVAGSALEWRDHEGRIAHFLQFVRKNASKYTDREHLYDDAAKSVRDWHPSANDLTHIERSVLAQLVPFYSWIRKAAPRIIQSVYQHPGRVLSTYQASYNLGVIGGTNPNTLADPLDPDQAFPSYLSDEGYGPQFDIGGRQYAINPGVPTFDVLGMLSNPQTAAGNFLNMEAPIDIIPEEIATRTEAGTGTPITDWGDFIDQQIPGVSDIASMTGLNLAGTAFNALTGRDATKGPGIGTPLDYNSSIEANDESKQTYTQRSAINYLLGARATSWTDKNDIQGAEGEQSATTLIPYLVGKRGLTGG